MQAMASEDYESAAQFVKDFLDLDLQPAMMQDQVEGTQAEQQHKACRMLALQTGYICLDGTLHLFISYERSCMTALHHTPVCICMPCMPSCRGTCCNCSCMLRQSHCSTCLRACRCCSSRSSSWSALWQASCSRRLPVTIRLMSCDSPGFMPRLA